MSSGTKPERPLDSLRRTGQTSTTKNDQAPNINSAEVKISISLLNQNIVPSLKG